MSDARPGARTVRIPPLLAAIRGPWFGTEVPFAIQEHVRFASTLTERDGKAYTIRFTSGGQGTILEEPVAPETAAQLKSVMSREYLDGRIGTETDAHALREYLSRRGVELVLSSSRIPCEVFEISLSVCGILPEGHVGHECFRTLELGGWGHGGAKTSEYEASRVHLFTFATKGARRNFAALLLHEIGHASFARWLKSDRPVAEAIHQGHRRIRRLAVGDVRFSDLMPFAVDYLLGPESRVEECFIDLREFAAEMYLIYVIRGRRLLEIFPTMPEEHASAWTQVYDALRRGFGGTEYE